MTQALNPAFFGKTVPLAGQRRAKGADVARLITAKVERLANGRYLVTHWMHNRCFNLVECGSRSLYVMDDFGNLVYVADGGRAWW